MNTNLDIFSVSAQWFFPQLLLFYYSFVLGFCSAESVFAWFAQFGVRSLEIGLMPSCC